MKTIYTILLLSLSILLQAQPQVVLQQIASGFSSPIEITHAGDERLFIVERAGRIKIIDADGMVLDDLFLDITDRVHSFGGQGEIGLLGLAFHPDYATNGYFYVYYTNNDDDSNLSRFRVSTFNSNVASVSSEEVLMTIPQPYLNHNGGCLRFGPDGYLYMGLGDGGSAGDPENRSQNPQELLGKMLRIDVNNGDPYGIPPDNPFIGDPNTQDLIWALGMRNPWRFSFDKLTGDLWIGDVGQGEWEEIDFQEASSTGGENYGWRCYEGDSPYNTSGCGNASDYTTPVHAYNHEGFTHCSVTGGHVYRGGEYEDMQGYYFYADYCSGQLWAIQKTGNTFTNYEVGNYPGYDISSFGEGIDGALYAARIGNGRIYKLVSSNCEDFTVTSNLTDETCNGDNNGAIDLTVSNGSGSYVFDWSNGADTEDLNNINSGVYSVTISDDNGCNILESFQLVSGTPSNPSIEANSATTFCEGDLVVLNAYDLPADYGYQWFQDGNELVGETDQSLVASATGSYYVSITGDACGVVSGTSNWIEVTAVETPTQPFVNSSGDNTFCNGESVTLTTTAAPPGYVIEWYVAGTLLSGENGETLVVSQAGSYYALYNGLCPTPTSNWTEITVQNLAPTAQYTYDGDESFCEGESVLLTANAAPNGYGYQWYLEGNAISGEMNQNLMINASGTYSVLYTTGPCPSSDVFEVEFLAIPLPAVPELTISSDTIFATAGAASYSWYLDGNLLGNSTDNFLIPQTNGNYTVEFFNMEGCSAISTGVDFIIDNLQEIGIEALQISPNPFSHSIVLTLDLMSAMDLEIEVFDSAGKQVRVFRENAAGKWSKRIDLSVEANGVYILKIATGRGSVSRRLVKN